MIKDLCKIWPWDPKVRNKSAAVGLPNPGGAPGGLNHMKHSVVPKVRDEHVCITRVQCPWGPEESVGSAGTGVIGGCMSLVGVES